MQLKCTASAIAFYHMQMSTRHISKDGLDIDDSGNDRARFRGRSATQTAATTLNAVSTRPFAIANPMISSVAARTSYNPVPSRRRGQQIQLLSTVRGCDDSHAPARMVATANLVKIMDLDVIEATAEGPKSGASSA